MATARPDAAVGVLAGTARWRGNCGYRLSIPVRPQRGTGRPSGARRSPRGSQRQVSRRVRRLLDRRLLLGLARGGLLGPRALIGQLPAGILQVGADEPLELLQFGGVFLENVLGHGIKVTDAMDGLAGVFDYARVHEVERRKVGLHGIAADGVVVP